MPIRFAAAICALFLATPALADQGYLTVGEAKAGLSGAALNDGTAANRTLTVTLTHDGTATGRPIFSKLKVVVAYTYSNASTVTDAFSCSLDGTTYGGRTSSSTNAGATTRYAESGTYTTGAASFTKLYEYEVKGCKKVQILFGGAGANSGDLVSTTHTPIAGS